MADLQYPVYGIILNIIPYKYPAIVGFLVVAALHERIFTRGRTSVFAAIITTAGINTSRELFLRIDYLSTILKTNMDIVVLTVLASAIVIFGGIAVYLAEHHHEGANITNLGDGLWWAVVTVATVGYGDYYPVTTVGRIIAVFMMLSGIGIFVLLVGSLSQRRLQRTESRLKRKTQARLLGDEEKTSIRNKIDEIEKLIKEVHTLLDA